jgi:hypothetical protein
MSRFQFSSQPLYNQTYDLPPLFDFNEIDNKYYQSKYAEIIGKVIEKIVDKSDNIKVFNSIEYGFDAINTYVSGMFNYFKTRSKSKLNYDNLINLFEKRYIIKRKNKNKPDEPIKKKFGIIFNPFYFIMIYLILKHKKFNILPDDDDIIDSDNYSDLNFDVDRLTQSNQSGMYGAQSGYPGQSNSSFSINAWKVIKNLLEMLYGKYNDRNPKSITSMTSVLKYLYALFLETVQITQSIDDALLLPDCAINITTLDNKNFLRKVFSQCNSLNQMRGGSRSNRKEKNPCKTADESISTITKMLNKKQNIICELIKFTVLEINKVNNNYELAYSDSLKPKKIDNQMLIDALAKSIIYDPTKIQSNKNDKSDETYNNKEIDSYYIDNVPFYKKIFKLYLISAKHILDQLKKNLSSKQSELKKIKKIIKLTYLKT